MSLLLVRAGVRLLKYRPEVRPWHFRRHRLRRLHRKLCHVDAKVAFVGGIDLCHSRRDDAGHAGDPQPQTMAAAYGPTPPWHDVQLEIRGPAVGDLAVTFPKRWDDPTPLDHRNPWRAHIASLAPQPRPPEP